MCGGGYSTEFSNQTTRKMMYSEQQLTSGTDRRAHSKQKKYQFVRYYHDRTVWQSYYVVGIYLLGLQTHIHCHQDHKHTQGVSLRTKKLVPVPSHHVAPYVHTIINMNPNMMHITRELESSPLRRKSGPTPRSIFFFIVAVFRGGSSIRPY